MSIGRTEFGALPDGRVVHQYRLQNTAGMIVDVLTYGATIRQITAPDRAGEFSNCVLGFETLEEYLQDMAYTGRAIGRVAGRIRNSRFTLEGINYNLTPTEGANHLHGGPEGFHQALWEAEVVKQSGQDRLVLRHTSPDGTGGYPGTVSCTLSFSLSEKDKLQMEMMAETDQPTPINLTRHEYFNLAQPDSSDVLDHEISIRADQYTPFTEDLTPTGTIAPVAGTALDLQSPVRLGEQFSKFPEDLVTGYDHYLVLQRQQASQHGAAILRVPETGRQLTVKSNQPGLVFYTGGYLPERPYAGLCLEPQGFPDAINQPAFPSVVLRPGEVYRNNLTYSFSCTNA